MKSQKVHIRWMIRRDMPDVLRIDDAAHADPWLEEDYLTCLRQRNAIAMVAESGDKILGVMAYELHKSQLVVRRFVVDPREHRTGVGRAMIEKLKGKLSTHRRSRLTIPVNEHATGAHLFLRACGFRATKVLRRYYECGSDCYVFAYHCPDAVPQAEMLESS